MGYRVSLIANMALSAAFILLGLLAMANVKDFTVEAITVLVVYFFCYFVFGGFDTLCYRIYKCNNEKAQVPVWVKRAGNILFVLVILSVLTIIFSIFSALYYMSGSQTSITGKQKIYFMIFLFSFVLPVITAVINTVYYVRALRKNKRVVTEFINDIGL